MRVANDDSVGMGSSSASSYFLQSFYFARFALVLHKISVVYSSNCRVVSVRAPPEESRCKMVATNLFALTHVLIVTSYNLGMVGTDQDAAKPRQPHHGRKGGA